MSGTCIPHITLIPYSAVGSYQKVLELWGGGEGEEMCWFWGGFVVKLFHIWDLCLKELFILKNRKASIMGIDINRHQ